jgi:hypothetical protein
VVLRASAHRENRSTAEDRTGRCGGRTIELPTTICVDRLETIFLIVYIIHVVTLLRDSFCLLATAAS